MSKFLDYLGREGRRPSALPARERIVLIVFLIVFGLFLLMVAIAMFVQTNFFRSLISIG